LGAVCFASEGIVSSLYTQLQNGILGAASFSKEALIFFDIHIDLDNEHAAKLAALIEPRISKTEDIMTINRAILEAMDARVQFFNGIECQISQSNSDANSSLLALHFISYKLEKGVSKILQ
jgi:pyrroloquinoline-quinone synthase